MTINKETLQKIAHLARLSFNEETEKNMLQDINKILDWMQKLNEINTEGVEPLIHMTNEVNIFREDQVANTLSHENALLNAPKKDSNYFRVPKVLE